MTCDNFLYQRLQGHALRARRAAQPWPGSWEWARGSPRGVRERDEGAAPLAAGVAGSLAGMGRQLGPLPLARQRTGAGRCRRAVTPHPPPGGPHRYAPRVAAPARAAGPSSSRRASCRRAKITVKSAPYDRVLRMALRATPDCDLPRQRTGTYQPDGPNSTRPLLRCHMRSSTATPSTCRETGRSRHMLFLRRRPRSYGDVNPACYVMSLATSNV